MADVNRYSGELVNTKWIVAITARIIKECPSVSPSGMPYRYLVPKELIPDDASHTAIQLSVNT